MIRAWGRLKRHGIWPVAGGQEDQVATFLEVVDFLDAEQAWWEEKEREQKRRA